MSAIPESSKKSSREHLNQVETPTSRPADAGLSELSAWERLSFSIAHELAAILLRTLGLRGLFRLGRFFGTLEWCINFKRRRRFGRVLQFVFPTIAPRDRRRHTREHFRQTRCDKLYYLVFDRIPRETALGSLSIRNRDVLDRAVSGGRGVYVAICHHGPHHVGGMLMALSGYKMAGVRDRQEGAMRRYVQSLYDQKYPEFGRAKILYANTFPREIYRCLKEGYVLASAMDVSRIRDSKQSYFEADMFGRKQVFLTGPVRIALRCKAPIFQAFVLPGPDFQYELDFVGPLIDGLEQECDEDTATDAAMRQYVRNVERYVEAHPSLLTRA